MGLVAKLGHFEDPETGESYSVLTFGAALSELARGGLTKAQIVTHFGMDTDTESDLDWLITQYNAVPTAEGKAQFVTFIRLIFLLAESQFPGYTTEQDLVAKINGF